MRAFVLSLVAALAIAAVGGSAGAADRSEPAKGGYWRGCGERIVGEATIVKTKSHAVPCRLARKISKRYALGNRHPLGFNCTEPTPEPTSGFEVSKGVCRREGALVKVIFGI